MAPTWHKLGTEEVSARVITHRDHHHPTTTMSPQPINSPPLNTPRRSSIHHPCLRTQDDFVHTVVTVGDGMPQVFRSGLACWGEDMVTQGADRNLLKVREGMV